MPRDFKKPASRDPARTIEDSVEQSDVTNTEPVKRAAAAELVITSGGVVGETYRLTDDEVLIGRSSDAGIVLNDESVSKKHALIRSVEGGWVLSDLGSGQKTRHNGDTVAGEATLNDGDVIEVGAIAFQFALEGSPRANRPPVRSSRRDKRATRARRTRAPQSAARRRIVWAVVFAFGLGAAALSGIVVADWNRQKREQLVLSAAQNARDELAISFQQVKKRVRSGEWREAQAALLELKARDEAFFVEQKMDEYLARAEIEIPHTVALQNAAAAIEKDDLIAAQALIDKVKDSTQEELVRATKLAMNRKLDERTAKARGLIAAGNSSGAQEALELIDAVLTIRPDDSEGIQLKLAAESILTRQKGVANLRPSAADLVVAGIRSKYQSGDVAGALAAAMACATNNAECERLKTQIKDFDSKSRRIDDLSEGELSELVEIDRRIAGGLASAGSKGVRSRVAAALYLKAASAKTTGANKRALDLGRRAMQADGSHTGAQLLVSDLLNQAHTTYLRGYQLRETSPEDAIRFFTEVINTTPADNEDHVKAQQWLQQIQK